MGRHNIRMKSSLRAIKCRHLLNNLSKSKDDDETYVPKVNPFDLHFQEENGNDAIISKLINEFNFLANTKRHLYVLIYSILRYFFFKLN